MLPYVLMMHIAYNSNTSTIKIDRILPTLFEAAGMFVVASAILIIGNTKSLLDYYSLGSLNEVLQNSAGQAVRSGLDKVDSYSFTYSLVTFLVWAIIGVVCFSIAQVAISVYNELRQEEQVSSNAYIHPRSFRRSLFWKQVLTDLVLSAVGMFGLLGGLFLLLLYVLPISLTYTRSFLVGFEIMRAPWFLIGFFMLYLWMLILTTVLKLTLNRHRLR